MMMEKALESENSQTHKIKILSTWAGIALLIFGLGFLMNNGIDIVIAILLSLAILLCMLLIRFVLSVMSKQAQEHRFTKWFTSGFGLVCLFFMGFVSASFTQLVEKNVLIVPILVIGWLAIVGLVLLGIANIRRWIRWAKQFPTWQLWLSCITLAMFIGILLVQLSQVESLLESGLFGLLLIPLSLTLLITAFQTAILPPKESLFEHAMKLIFPLVGMLMVVVLMV
jgi:hypothetical protein